MMPEERQLDRDLSAAGLAAAALVGGAAGALLALNLRHSGAGLLPAHGAAANLAGAALAALAGLGGAGAVAAIWARRALRAAAKARRQLEEALRDSEERCRTLAETAADAMVTFDAAGAVVRVDPAAERLLGFSAAEVVERHLREDRKRFEVLSEISRIALEDLEYRPMLQRICDTLARTFDWEFVAFISIVPERDCFVCEALNTACPTTIHVGYQRQLGSGVVGQVAATGQPILLDDVRSFPNYVETLPGAQSELCVPVTHKGSNLAVLNLESTRLAAFHQQLPFLTKVAEQVAGALASARLYEDVLQRASLALVDGLTGIANRRRFDAELEREWRRGSRSRIPLSLVLLDVDCFKLFNDLYGHPDGDECLRRVAAALADVSTRAADLVARYGGEEFAMVLPDLDAGGAARLAESARARIEALAIPHGASTAAPVVTVSAGAATRYPGRGSSAATLIAAADRALYLAKRQGRNRVQTAAATHGRPPRRSRPQSAGSTASS